MRHVISRRFSLYLSFGVVAFIVLAGASACEGDSQEAGTDRNRQEAVEDREEEFNEAVAAVPVPEINSYPQRQALSDFMVRQSLVNHPWYVYILAPMTGSPIGYFVAKTYPVSNCNFMSPSERIVDEGIEGSQVVTAPSYDGMLYGGGGASAACSMMFFFDLTTNAMITYQADLMISSDSPISLFNVPQIKPDNAPPGVEVTDEGDTPPDSAYTGGPDQVEDINP